VTTNQMTSSRFSGNRRTLVILAGVVGLMVGMAYASVPLYKLFCQVTGYGGTTQATNDAATHIVAGHPITVRFDANVNRGLDWKFLPVDRPVTLNPGEEVVIHYRATNKGSAASVGTSTFNVTPAKAGIYFMKIDCFCFQEQTLQPGESVDMPVRFFIDPEIVADKNVVDVTDMTLSYTFFPALVENK
jgi:cytochrome c oxidase assembly protein subunit 11